MKKGLIIGLFILVLITGCIERDIKLIPEAPPNSILIYVDENPEDVNNINLIHIANIMISEGKLELIIIKEHEEIGRLRTAIIEIQAKETLPLTIELREDDGTVVIGDKLVRPKEPEYIYAVQKNLINYGFLGKFEK